MILWVWISWWFWHLVDEDCGGYERCHYEELERASDGLGLDVESDDDHTSRYSSDLDEEMMPVDEMESEDVVFELEMYEALSGSQAI